MSKILGGVSTNTECASNIDLTINWFLALFVKKKQELETTTVVILN